MKLPRYVLAVLAVPFAMAQPADKSALEASDLDRVVELASKACDNAGIAVAIVDGDRVAYLKGIGFADRDKARPVTPRSLFYIASTTKSFTALTGVLLERRGVIKLDAALADFFPSLELQAPLSPKQITLRNLLTMTHGIRGGPVDFRLAYTGDLEDAGALALLKHHQPLKTGSEFSYSNLPYNLFGFVLDRKVKGGWRQAISSEVFAPLGMRRTTATFDGVPPEDLALPHELGPEGLERIYYGKKNANMHSAGGHLSSAEDLAQYLLAQINGGHIGGKQVFPAEAIAETHKPQATQSQRWGEYQRDAWGLGWDIGSYEGAKMLSRFGGFAGFHSHVSFMPGERAGMVVLSNAGGAGAPLAEIIANYAYDRVLRKADAEQRLQARLERLRDASKRRMAAVQQDRARRGARSQETALPLAAYAGAYDNAVWGRIVLEAAVGRLRFRMGAAEGEVEVFDGTKHQFRIALTGPGEVISFETPAENRVTAFRFRGELYQRADAL